MGSVRMLKSWISVWLALLFFHCTSRPITYTNPILHADYSDPDVIRVGDDYYMVSSSFSHVPGLPVLHSRDLVHWEILGHAVQRLPDPVYDRPQHGKGIWAPSIRHHEGFFRIYYGDPDFGIYRVQSAHAAGPWEPPLLIHAARGWIDPCPFWDEDGQAYLVHAWAKSRVGFNSILTLHRMTPDGTRILDEGVTVFDGHANHPTIEGPKIYKRNGWYYIFAPAGGVKTGWQTVLRSRSLFGPYEARIVLEQGVTGINGPHQGAWVEMPNGGDRFIHFQDRGAYGRIIHLQPMRWEEDWPVMGVDLDGDGIGEPVSTGRVPRVKDAGNLFIPASDDFAEGILGLQWQWQANSDSAWYELDEGKGCLRLYGLKPGVTQKTLWDAPNILAQKFPAEKFTATVKLRLESGVTGDRAGVVVLGSDYATLSLVRDGDAWIIQQTRFYEEGTGVEEEIAAAMPVDSAEICFRVQVREGAVVQFSYSTYGGCFIPFGSEFAAKPGKWVGAKVGLFAQAASQAPAVAEFDDFEVMIIE